MDNYETLRLIGSGSYGEVHLVRDRRSGKKYVMKKIDLENASAREREFAQREAMLLSELKHPNIVALKESFYSKAGTSLFISMAYCEGGDLYSRVKAQRGSHFEERQVIEWFVQIALAIQYLHNKNVLHRDLKTQNIFLTKNNIIKVGDFGIARVLDSCADMATTMIGTPYYMSPELFSNLPYNFKSDIWALGCCMYELTTLKQAFNARDMHSLVYKVLHGTVARIPELYSAELSDLIVSMMDRNPDNRPTVTTMLKLKFVRKHIELFLGNKDKAGVDARGRAAADSEDTVTPSDSTPSDNAGGSAASSRKDSRSNASTSSSLSSALPSSSSLSSLSSAAATSISSSSGPLPSAPASSSSPSTSSGSVPAHPPSSRLAQASKVSSSSASSATPPPITAATTTAAASSSHPSSSHPSSVSSYPALSSSNSAPPVAASTALHSSSSVSSLPPLSVSSSASSTPVQANPVSHPLSKASSHPHHSHSSSSHSPATPLASHASSLSSASSSSSSLAHPTPLVVAPYPPSTHPSSSSTNDSARSVSRGIPPNAVLPVRTSASGGGGVPCVGRAAASTSSEPYRSSSVPTSASAPRVLVRSESQQDTPPVRAAEAAGSINREARMRWREKKQAPAPPPVAPAHTPHLSDVSDLELSESSSDSDTSSPAVATSPKGWLEDSDSAPGSGEVEETHAAMLGTPTRGPLIDRAEKLRGLCIQSIGDKNYAKALQIWKTQDPDTAEVLLLGLLGEELFDSVRGLLAQLMMCEEAIVKMQLEA